MYIIGNWKMNGSLQSCDQFIDQMASGLPQKASSSHLWLAPPFPYLHTMAKRLAPLGIHVGGQNCFHQTSGAYTGEVSPQMIRDVGGSFVIVGHSERRLHQGENSALVAQKCRLAQEADLSVVLCIGESMEIRQRGTFLSWLSRQLQESLPEERENLLIAYEPIWSIGTGQVPTPQEIAEVANLCRQHLPSAPILYGGSVTGDNLRDIVDNGRVDGVLVGGASLRPQDFLSLVHKGVTA